MRDQLSKRPLRGLSRVASTATFSQTSLDGGRRTTPAEVYLAIGQLLEQPQALTMVSEMLKRFLHLSGDTSELIRLFLQQLRSRQFGLAAAAGAPLRDDQRRAGDGSVPEPTLDWSDSDIQRVIVQEFLASTNYQAVIGGRANTLKLVG